MKKFLSILMSIILIATIFTGCNKKENQGTTPQNNNGKTTIRFLNFKPEIATVYDEIAKAYKNETINDKAASEAEPIAKPLPIAAVVLPTESNLSVISRTAGSNSDISAIPPALSEIGP